MLAKVQNDTQFGAAEKRMHKKRVRWGAGQPGLVLDLVVGNHAYGRGLKLGGL